MSDEKSILRQEALRHRGRLDPASEAVERTVEHFFTAVNPQLEQTIAGYWPTEREFDPRPVLFEALQRGYVCGLPAVMKGSKILRFLRWQENTDLAKGVHGIFEPPAESATIEPDIVLVPLLAYDRRGYRLGYGGGYYDATLADLRARKPLLAVGMAYAQQACLFPLPAEAHDQRLDLVITPQGAQDFRN